MRAWTLQTRRRLVVVAALVIAGILAFPLRQAVYETIVIPSAFIAWNLQLLYRSFSQGIWWWIVVGLVLLMLVFSLVPPPRFRGRADPKPKPHAGQVEGLAVWLHKAERGIYFKWLVANRLGKLAYQILLQRESGRPRSVFDPLLGLDWQPPRDLQRYLEVGLHGSFTDFPEVKRRLGTPQKTSLDHNIVQAVEFLESQVENENGSQT